MNPFIITGEYISSEYFCDRERDTSTIESNVVNGRNTVLISSRRMGKTGLISHFLSQPGINAGYRSFLIDLYSTNSLQEMVMMLSREIIRKSKTTGERVLESFVDVVKSLRPGVKMDPVTGQLVFDLSLGEISHPLESIEEIFEYLEASPQPCIVAIDEFQQIADYPEKNTLALLRTYVQRCRKTSFIFAGSKRRMMEKLFNSPSEPFYQSCVPLYLEAIEKDAYFRFAEKHFHNAGRSLTEECFEELYRTFDGHTWYVQRILNEMYASNEAVLTPVQYHEALDYVIKLGEKAFEEQFRTYSNSHKQLLIAIAKEGKAAAITSMAFVRKHALKSPSTVQSSARQLYDAEVITREENSYYISNRLFSMWIRENYCAIV